MATTLFPDPTLIVKSLVVRPVEREEEARYQAQMARHHYLGALHQWLAQIGFSAAALKCGARDRWIGWGCSSVVAGELGARLARAEHVERQAARTGNASRCFTLGAVHE